MSRRGNVYDNAAMESWFSTLKSELGERFEAHAVAKEQLFDYIEVFYNQQRLHSAIGYISPAAFERAVQQGKQAAQSTCLPNRITPTSSRMRRRNSGSFEYRSTSSNAAVSGSPSPAACRRVKGDHVLILQRVHRQSSTADHGVTHEQTWNVALGSISIGVT